MKKKIGFAIGFAIGAGLTFLWTLKKVSPNIRVIDETDTSLMTFI